MPMGHQSHKKNLMSLMQILLLLVLLLSIHHVDSGTIVKFLPGFEGPLPFELETGYIGIGEKEEIQLFYYFIKSENSPQEDPLLIWMSGGPGCSSISGLLYEIGPVAIKTEAYHVNIPSLVSTTHSWTKMANIVFLDQPVGTGFSYKRTPITEKTSDTKEIVRVHEFLKKWLDRHPEFYSNPFYVGGDSYSGKIVPGLVQRISTENYICCKPPINLQGYVLGNPVTDLEEEINYQIPFTHGMGLISNELYESMKRICKGYYVNEDSQNPECLQLIETFEKCTEKINKLDILLPNCDVTSPDCFSYKDTLLSYWTNDERVREALQIRKGSVGEWKRCESILYDKDIKSAVAYHMNNSINGYRSLIYNGDHDMLVSFLATEAWIKSLNYSIIDDWRPWMNKDNILGYTRTYANKMTYATIKGGGHTAEYKPEESFMMFQRWITGQLL